MSKLLCIHSENGSTLKGKNLLPLGANSFLYSRPIFRRGLAAGKQTEIFILHCF